MVDCPYTDKCTRFPHSCSSCRNNTGKRDYYEPDDNYPWYPQPSPWYKWHYYDPYEHNTTGVRY